MLVLINSSFKYIHVSVVVDSLYFTSCRGILYSVNVCLRDYIPGAHILGKALIDTSFVTVFVWRLQTLLKAVLRHFVN